MQVCVGKLEGSAVGNRDENMKYELPKMGIEDTVSRIVLRVCVRMYRADECEARGVS